MKMLRKRPSHIWH